MALRLLMIAMISKPSMFSVMTKHPIVPCGTCFAEQPMTYDLKFEGKIEK